MVRVQLNVEENGWMDGWMNDMGKDVLFISWVCSR